MSTARQIAPALAAALLAGGAVYGLLAAVRPAAADREDPWLKAWTLAGIPALPRGTSTEPSRHLQLRLQRQRFTGPAFAGTRLRSYTLRGFRAQVVELPSADLSVFDDPERPEDAGLFRYDHGEADHYCRQGRYLLILAARQRVAFWPMALPEETREKAMGVFRQTARGFP